MAEMYLRWAKVHGRKWMLRLGLPPGSFPACLSRPDVPSSATHLTHLIIYSYSFLLYSSTPAASLALNTLPTLIT